ncbi:putative mannosyltransferase [Paratrimastix pyriformis]|uniref:Alpha-1,3/1,6-mannosyltransferase ALG2 n=1 Tax=Paratrimastix pyriformis TaxID=342808 RepID=A0ABQ8UMC4_9EUKA|nr:putative mannosyltransferase [Paratrimastix pyriformis]
MQVAFLHPDLGLGGAERLVIDAAVGLQKLGNHVHMYTSHCDKKHCFSEARDGTLSVTVLGDWIPRSFFRRFAALFAYVRMLYLALGVALFGPSFDVIVCDQISACIPILKLLTRAKIVFYCHYPDQLLCTDRRSLLKRLYRWPIDRLEAITTGMAHRVLVNSKYTASIFHATFTHIKTLPAVLYPPINSQAYTAVNEALAGELKTPASAADPEWLVPLRGKHLILSLNRFERKKNLRLAVDMMAQLRTTVDPATFANTVLVIAGGYDPLCRENIEYHSALEQYAQQLNLGPQVVFKRSFTEAERNALLRIATCLVYTPSFEHFGIVPVEAMYCGVPPVAVANGGPCESVLDGVTGFLCPCPSAPPASAQRCAGLDTPLGDLQVHMRLAGAFARCVACLIANPAGPVARHPALPVDGEAEPEAPPKRTGGASPRGGFLLSLCTLLGSILLMTAYTLVTMMVLHLLLLSLPFSPSTCRHCGCHWRRPIRSPLPPPQAQVSPVPADETAALARSDGPLRTRMGRAGRQRAREMFALEVFGSRLDQTLREVLMQKVRRE